MHPTTNVEWLALLYEQDAVFARGQAASFGITDSMIRAQVKAHRWQRLHPGVFAAHNGSLGFRARAWAAVLFCGHGAALSLRAGGYVAGLIDRPPAMIDVSVPGARRPRGAPGIRVTRRHRMPCAVGGPPRLPIDEVVLDLVGDAATPDDVVGFITSACQRRLTTAARLRAAADLRQKLAWRALANDVLADADETHSPLEWRYRRDVERAHGLPRSVGQVATTHGASKQWRDAVYEEYGLVVELDGAAAHPEERRHRDMARDNAVAVDGGRSLRYGWHDVAGHACEAADQVAIVLHSAGWRGMPRACGPRCRIAG